MVLMGYRACNIYIIVAKYLYKIQTYQILKGIFLPINNIKEAIKMDGNKIVTWDEMFGHEDKKENGNEVEVYDVVEDVQGDNK